MARKKKVESKRVADEKNAPEGGMVLGYDLNWMKELESEHPDYKKVMKEARKKKYL